MKNSNFKVGLVIFVIGVLLFLNIVLVGESFSLKYLWPLIPLFAGLSLEMDYFTKTSGPNSLISGGILTGLGVFYLLLYYIRDWNLEAYKAPALLLIVGLAFLQYYVFTRKNTRSLLIAIILIAVSALLFFTKYYNGYSLWINGRTISALAVILFGLFLMLSGPKRRTYGKESSYRSIDDTNDN